MKIKFCYACIIGLLFSYSNAFGAGFQLRYQSAEAMGTAFSSVGTSGKALSHVYYNPGSVFLAREEGKDNSFAFEGTFIIPISNEVTTDGTGNTEDDFASFTFVPTAYYAKFFGEDLAFTLSFNSPWATNTDYSTDWDGRYHALETFLGSFNLTPALSKKINDKWILSAGLQLQYLFGTLSTAVDAGSLGFGSVPGAMPQQNDVLSEFKGDSFGLGLTFGFTYLMDEKTTLMFNFISAIQNKLSGDVEFSTLTGGALTDAIIAGSPLLTDSDDAELNVETPNIISLGLSRVFSEKITGHASANYATWSSFENLTTRVNGAVASQVAQNWKDSFFLSGGATVKASESFTWRAGVFYETSAPDDIRSPRTIDADKIGLAFGSTIDIGKVDLDLALNQIFYVGDFDIDLANVNSIPGTAFAGEVDSHITLIRAGVTYNW